MKRFALAFLLALWVAPAFADDVYVNGYFRNNGTYVQPHWRSSPDSNTLNNWSTQGNINPYTGQYGTVNPYSLPSYNNYAVPQYQSAPLRPKIRSSYD